VGASAAALLCGLFGLGAIAVSGVPSGAATSATLYVDNVNGGATTGCTSAGAGACKTIQEGVTAAEALTGTAVTLNVAGSSTAYNESVTINLTAVGGDSLDIEGTGTTLPTLDNGGTGSGFIIPATSAGSITIANMTISHGAAAHGGAINDVGTGKLSLNSDTISDNTATSTGPGVEIAGCTSGATTGVLVVNDSTFSGNSGLNTDGAAINAGDCSGSATITVTNSTFDSNDAGTGGYGGAIALWKGTDTLTNDTFVGNIGEHGGGALLDGTSNVVNFDTFSSNSPAVDAYFATVDLSNSILAAGTASACRTEGGGSLTDNGHNVSSDASCGLGPNSISNSTTIGTLTLAANGSSGPQTAAITPSSSAAGIVPTSACTPNTDERGQPRPGIGYSTCDAGAFEIQKSTGYDLAGTDGGVFVFPVGMPAGFYGSIPGLGIHINNIRGIVPTNNYAGYDLAGSDGGVFVFPLGMASGFYGSLPGLHVSVNNVVGMVSTNQNRGYNLTGSDGGVFVFPTGQAAGYYGSLPGLGIHVNNIVGIVESPDGKGYFLVGSDGGVFAFGSVQYYGSLPGNHISVNNIVGISTTFDGKGYYLVGSDGSVYPFGDAVSHGSLPAMGIHVNNIVSVVPTADGGGYWLIGSDGGVFAFGNAGFIGSLPGLKPPVSVHNIIGAVPTLN
jgi:hypothetical protein